MKNWKLSSCAWTFGLSLALGMSELALASFTCGPYLLTYQVSSPTGQAGSGVRCVSLSAQKIDWYGEGTWELADFHPLIYRHAGSGYRSGNRAQAEAADIFGNGESATWRARNLILSMSGDPNAPQTISVGGDWNEVWTLAGNRVHPYYTSSLAPIAHCGAHYSEYRNYDANGQGAGVQCMLKSQYPSYMGVGAGQHGGTRYLHLLSQDQGSPGLGIDICDRSQADYCNAANLSFAPQGGNIFVGGWNESWSYAYPSGSQLPGARYVEYAIRNLGRQMGNGECWTLVFQAADFAGARRPSMDGLAVYEFGQLVGPPYQPGDIVQLFNAEINYPDGRYEYYKPQHSAIIEWVVGTQLGVLQQNVGGDRRVQRGVIDLRYVTSGSYYVYRPQFR